MVAVAIIVGLLTLLAGYVAGYAHASWHYDKAHRDSIEWWGGHDAPHNVSLSDLSPYDQDALNGDE